MRIKTLSRLVTITTLGAGSLLSLSQDKAPAAPQTATPNVTEQSFTGANDLKMMALAGISVAWRAKPVVREKATFALSHAPLDGVLAWFGDAASP
jgi:hypothetical protein